MRNLVANPQTHEPFFRPCHPLRPKLSTDTREGIHCDREHSCSGFCIPLLEFLTYVSLHSTRSLSLWVTLSVVVLNIIAGLFLERICMILPVVQLQLRSTFNPCSENSFVGTPTFIDVKVVAFVFRDLSFSRHEDKNVWLYRFASIVDRVWGLDERTGPLGCNVSVGKAPNIRDYPFYLLESSRNATAAPTNYRGSQAFILRSYALQ